MQRTMRRSDRALSEQETRSILNNGGFGVLSVIDGDGLPYGIPLHYAMIDNRICFHSTSGASHKAEGLRPGSPVAFAVLEMENAVEGRSAIAFGTARPCPELKRQTLESLVEKFVPEPGWNAAKEGIPHALNSFEAYCIEIERITGKRIEKPEGR